MNTNDVLREKQLRALVKQSVQASENDQKGSSLQTNSASERTRAIVASSMAMPVVDNASMLYHFKRLVNEK